jgi:hypothetical protein
MSKNSLIVCSNFSKFFIRYAMEKKLKFLLDLDFLLLASEISFLPFISISLKKLFLFSFIFLLEKNFFVFSLITSLKGYQNSQSLELY